MDQQTLKKLNGYHVVFLVQNTMVGLALLSLPAQLSPMGYSQWWLPIVFGVVANLTLIPMVWIFLRYKEDNLYTLNEKLLGKWLGKLINILLLLYLIVFLSAIIEGYLELIQVVALPDRRIFWSLLIFMLLLIYIVHGGIKSVARFCIMSFFLTVWMMMFLQWPLRDGEITHLLPLFNFSRGELMRASGEGYLSMAGYDLIMFYFPYILAQQKAFRHASIGIWITTFVYVSVTIVSVMYFSEWQMENLLYPILSLFKSVEMSFFERIDVMGISLWIFLLLSTSSGYLWVGKKGMDSLRANNKSYHLFLLTAVIFLVVIIPFPKDIQTMIYDRVFFFKFGIILWPNVLIILHLIRTRKRKRGVK